MALIWSIFSYLHSGDGNLEETNRLFQFGIMMCSHHVAWIPSSSTHPVQCLTLSAPPGTLQWDPNLHSPQRLEKLPSPTKQSTHTDMGGSLAYVSGGVTNRSRRKINRDFWRGTETRVLSQNGHPEVVSVIMPGTVASKDEKERDNEITCIEYCHIVSC